MLRLDINLVWEIINLFVLFLLLRHFLIRPVKAVMDERQAAVRRQFADAEAAESKAGELKDRYEGKLKSAHAEADELLNQARADAKAEYDRIVSEAEGKAGKILEDAGRAAAMEQEKLVREAESRIAVLVMAATAKVIGETSDHISDQSLYNQFLAKAGDSNDTTFS